MKKFLRILLCFMILTSMVVSFSACEKKIEEDPKVEGPSYDDPRFYEFETGLIGKKLRYKKIEQIDVSGVLGAKEGWRYRFDNNFTVEIYVFNEESDDYKASREIDLISSYGDPIAVKFNGSMCIYMNDWQNEITDAVYEVFKNVKVY